MRLLIDLLVAIGVLCYLLFSWGGAPLVEKVTQGNADVQFAAYVVLAFFGYLLIDAAITLFSLRPRKEEQKLPSDSEQELRRKLSALETKLSAAQSKIQKLSSAADRDQLINAEILNLLALLQEKGRLVDFLMEDVNALGDAQIGAAARFVHNGCRAVINSFFEVRPIFSGREGERITLESGFNAREYRLLGNVSDKPPYSGSVVHRGWAAKKVTLPRIIEPESSPAAAGVLAPCEVQV